MSPGGPPRGREDTGRAPPRRPQLPPPNPDDGLGTASGGAGIIQAAVGDEIPPVSRPHPPLTDAPERLPVRPRGGAPGRSGKALRACLGVAGAALLAVGAVSAGCGSLESAEVRQRTLALPKNAPLAERLRTGTLGEGGQAWMASHLPARQGAGGQAPIVLVHGTPDTMGAWTRLLFGAGGLAGEAPVWTLEVLGHGMCESAEGGGPVTFQRCADHVAATIEALGLEGVTLVGNSYGGEFCWRVALDHPELVSKLVLIDSSGLPRAREEFLSEEVKMREWSVARLGYLVNSEPRVASALDPHFDGGADPERVREVFLGLENRANWNAMIDLVRDENGERAADLAALRAPTLLLWGEHDKAYPPAAFGRTFEERIPDARLVVIEGAGHYPHEQDPGRVAREILAFHAEARR